MSAVSMPMPITRTRREDHEIWSSLWGLLELLQARLLDLSDSARQRTALRAMSRRNSASVLGGIVSALGRARALQEFRRLLKLRVEVADAELRQCRLDAVDDGGVLANKGLALAVGAFGIFLCEGRDRADLQWTGSLRSQPKRARSSCSVRAGRSWRGGAPVTPPRLRGE